jgi:hypothetical protein
MIFIFDVFLPSSLFIPAVGLPRFHHHFHSKHNEDNCSYELVLFFRTLVVIHKQADHRSKLTESIIHYSQYIVSHIVHLQCYSKFYCIQGAVASGGINLAYRSQPANCESHISISYYYIMPIPPSHRTVIDSSICAR